MMTRASLEAIAAARQHATRLLTGQLAVTRRQADSEQSERSKAAGSGRRSACLTVPDEPRNARPDALAARHGVVGVAALLAAARAAARRGEASTSRVRYAGASEHSAPLEGAARAGPGAGVRAQLETFRTSFPERGQLGTKFTHGARPIENSVRRELEAARLEAAGDVLAEQLADDPRAHYYRRAIARALEPLWLKRAVALASCGEAGARCDCADCGAPHVLPYRCGARGCPTCARSASAIACEKVARQAEDAALKLLGEWDGVGEKRSKAWRTLVLTTAAAGSEAERYDAETLRGYVLAVRRAWGPFWRSTVWGRRVNDVTARGTRTKRVRRDTLAAMGIEVGDGGMVHIHAAIYGEYVEAEEIARLWKAACPVGGFVRLRLMRERRGGPAVTSASSDAFRNALREVLKYLTKGHKTDASAGADRLEQRARRAAAAEYALRNQRRVETCGALRLVPAVTEKDVATQGKSCGGCLTTPSGWTWRGMRAPEYVRRNGGFGLSTIIDDADAEQLRTAVRAIALEEQQRAREAAAADAHKRRPGGEFYGGAPPPWWDDPDEWETVTVDGSHAV